MHLDEMNEDWRDEAPTLAALEKGNPFTVPETYFQEMAEQVKSQINITVFESETENLNVPEGYFESLTDRIVSRVKLDEIKDQDHAAIYNLPEGYFKNLEEKILSRISADKQEAKIRKLNTNWIKYASAACVTAILGVALYFSQKSKDLETQIGKLKTDEIVDYLQLYSDAGETSVLIQTLGADVEIPDLGIEASNNEIEQYLKSNM